MKEQRLIDANAIKQKVKNSTAIRSVKAGMLVFVDCAPTIDLETLPIVQELREQLSKVTSERDSLLKEMAGECGLCKYYDDCIKNHYSCGGYEWEWRGIE